MKHVIWSILLVACGTLFAQTAPADSIRPYKPLFSPRSPLYYYGYQASDIVGKWSYHGMAGIWVRAKNGETRGLLSAGAQAEYTIFPALSIGINPVYYHNMHTGKWVRDLGALAFPLKIGTGSEVVDVYMICGPEAVLWKKGDPYNKFQFPALLIGAGLQMGKSFRIEARSDHVIGNLFFCYRIK
jgi:hypothetical protein